MNATQKLVVVGQGYVGLPLAMRAVEVGFNVTGIDLDKNRVECLAAGDSYVDDISNQQLSEALSTGRYVPTDDYREAESFDFAIITVPTPLRESLPDLSFIESATRSLGPYLKPGATVVLESTTYPGTTEELLEPLLEQISGLSSETDFQLGYSPERIDPGNKVWGLVETPKVVSGIDKRSLHKIQDFYNQIVLTTVPVKSPKEAELTKLLENTFRHVNIALVNEVAIFAHQLGIDIWEAIDAASTKPFGYMRFTPGPGVGGHCLPVDPSYLSWQVRRKLGQNFRFIELANDINDHMPDYIIQRITAVLNKDKKALNGSKIVLVGLAYKKNTGDIRESPSLRLIDLLLASGAELIGVDDHVEQYRWPERVKRSQLTTEVLDEADAAILVTDHDDLDLAPLANHALSTIDTKKKLDTRTGLEYV